MLKTHATKNQFVYSHRYEVADIFLFDNVSSMHRPKEQTGSAGTADSDNATLRWRLSAKETPDMIKKS
tara:strand:+ start:840 stop:1043 length:204 start_codon:yes stop_codon:yes gene_type:complete